LRNFLLLSRFQILEVVEVITKMTILLIHTKPAGTQGLFSASLHARLRPA
jgi:hypothetical protein